MKFIFLKLFSFFGSLGFIGFPLVICSLFVVVVSVERSLFFIFVVRSDQILEKLKSLLQEYRYRDKAIREEVMSLELERVNNTLTFGIRGLKFATAIAPMLGLLGTIFGMIDVFSSISTSSTAVSPAMISAGLKTAMYATAFGLSITVFSMFMYFVLSIFIKNKMILYTEVLNEDNISIETENANKTNFR